MIEGYKCSFCDSFFSYKEACKKHEEHCGKNPSNKIDDKIVFRLSMILSEMKDIIAASLSDVCESDIPFLIGEFERADDYNCFCYIKQRQSEAIWILKNAEKIKDERKGMNTTKYQDITKDYPELFRAFVDVLKRPAWNER